MPPKNFLKITSRMKPRINNRLRDAEALTATPSILAPNPGGTLAPAADHNDTHTPVAPVEGSISSRPCNLPRIELDNWGNLKGLMDTLNQAAATSGFGPVKSVIEGLVDLIGLYEDAARGQKEYDDLRLQLECIFDELKHYLSPSSVLTTSIDNICWSIQKEMKIVKARRARPKKRKREEMDNAAYLVLECYQRIGDHLKRLSRNANISTWVIVDQLATDNRLQKLVPSLWPCYNSEKALELERRSCTEGTRESVLAQMHQWTTNRNAKNIYWMSGMAGTGKTTIAYSLCEWLDAEPNRMLCASFFCSRSLPECRDVGRIIPSIAYQLARYSRPFQYALSRALEKDPDAHTRLPPMQFDSLLVKPLSDTKVQEALPTNVVAVIDALDECENTKSTKLIMDVLLTKAKALPIKFVVSSRPEPAIRDQMEKNGTWVDARVVLHELDKGEVQTDIKTYLKVGLDPIKPSESEIEQLVARAGVLFIYAATVIRYVGYDDFGWDPRARLDMVLGPLEEEERVLTNEIDELYGTILRTAYNNPMLSKKERDNMKLVLNTVICARRPLTSDALNNLLKLGGVARVEAALRPLWSVLHVMRPNMTVTTLHASFPDYLLDSTRSGAWHCDAGAHHHLLAQRCFECIQNTKPQFNICQLESSYLADDEVEDLDARVQEFISTELSYACRYWSSHVDSAGPGAASSIAPLLSQFLTAQLLLWMEVRNLTQTIPETLDELMAAKRWATQHRVARDTVDLLSDAWRFASTIVSSPVSQSTPHIYISMLPLLPLHSPIRRHYLDRFQGLIGVEGKALYLRKDALLAQWKFDMATLCITGSPDGTQIAIGGGDDEYHDLDRICILDALSGALLLDLSWGDEALVYSIAFSPDSTRLVSGTSEGLISLWDVTDGQLVFDPFEAHSGIIESIIYSHDGAFIVSASEDKTIRIWDALSGEPILPPLIGHTEFVTCIAITSDDARLVSGSYDCTVRVWDISNGKLLLDPITAHDDWVSAIALSLDNSYVVSGSFDSTIRFWDIQTGQMVLGPLKVQSNQVRSISISPNGVAVASTSVTGGVQIWDVASGMVRAQIGPFSHDSRHSNTATYSSDGTRIILARSDGTIRMLDAQAAATTSNLLPGHTNNIMSIDISPNCQRVVSGSYDHNLCVWDLIQGTLALGPLQGHTGGVYMVRFSPDGSRIVSCSWDKTIRQWDTQSGAAHGTPIRVAPIDPLSPFGVVSAAYSRDGARIASLTFDGEFLVSESSNGRLILRPPIPPRKPRGVHADFSPDGATVIAGYQDGSIGFWDVRSGQMVLNYQRHGRTDLGSDVLSLAFSPDGLYYAQAFRSGRIIVKNLHTGDQIPGAFEGHITAVRSVRFSHDGTCLVSGSDDYTVEMWDVETGESVFGPFIGHTNTVNSVAFTPDGQYIVSASDDIAIRVWDIQSNEPPGNDAYTNYADWELDEDGWVIDEESQRLFWVPSDLHTSLMQPWNIALMFPNDYLRLNFQGAFIGEAWTNCWRNC